MEDKRLYIDFYYLFSVTCNDCFIYGISKCTFTFWYSFYRTHALFYLEKLYSLLSALIIAMLYTSFHLLEVYDPIWIVVDRLFLLSSALVYASVLLHEDRILRLCSLYIGMLQGELFVTIIFRKLHFPYDYGSLAFLISLLFLHYSWQFYFGLRKSPYTWNSLRGKHVKERRG